MNLLSLFRKKEKNIEDIFADFVGNEGAVTQLKRSIKFALQSKSRSLNPIGLFGPRSTGKTELAKRISKAMDLPLIHLTKHKIKNENLFLESLLFAEEMSLHQIAFIDEAHLIPNRVQDLLLTSLEQSDRLYHGVFESYNMSNISFIIATTDPHQLGEAFKSRLNTFYLNRYTDEQVVQILYNKFGSNKYFCTIPKPALFYIAKISRLVPRIAIRMTDQLIQNILLGEVQCTTHEIVKDLCYTNNCNVDGITLLDLKYIATLYPDKRLGLNTLSVILGEKRENIESEIEPFLVENKLIQITPRGRQLTEKGKDYLDLCGNLK